MKRIAYLLLSCATLMAAAGCSKEADKVTPSGPKEYQVEYRVSSTTPAAQADIDYTNESGGNTNVEDAPLPASYKFKRTMKNGDTVLILAALDDATATSEITASILIDGKEVKKETGRGVNASAAPLYLIAE